ncbi:TPA: hypothetical protein DIC40_04940 [Patescibacteria group bacterium]|nr:hypothetical protein [Candidatus Gracilibacteria bacterium]
MLGIQNIDIHKILGEKEYKKFSTIQEHSDTYLMFPKKIYTQIKQYVNTKDRKITIIDLLNISLENLSSGFKKHLISKGITPKTLIKNCKMIAENPIVIEQ